MNVLNVIWIYFRRKIDLFSRKSFLSHEKFKLHESIISRHFFSSFNFTFSIFYMKIPSFSKNCPKLQQKVLSFVKVYLVKIYGFPNLREFTQKFLRIFELAKYSLIKIDSHTVFISYPQIPGKSNLENRILTRDCLDTLFVMVDD